MQRSLYRPAGSPIPRPEIPIRMHRLPHLCALSDLEQSKQLGSPRIFPKEIKRNSGYSQSTEKTQRTTAGQTKRIATAARLHKAKQHGTLVAIAPPLLLFTLKDWMPPLSWSSRSESCGCRCTAAVTIDILKDLKVPYCDQSGFATVFTSRI